MCSVGKTLFAMQGTQEGQVCILWHGKSPGKWLGNPLQDSVFRESHGQRSLAGNSTNSLKGSDMTEVTEHVHNK